jgi:hypothetical protein
MPNGRNREPPTPHPIENQVRRATHNQLPHSRLNSSAAQVRLFPQELDQGDNARGQPCRRVRLVSGDEIPYLAQPRLSPARPDDLYRHKL